MRISYVLYGEILAPVVRSQTFPLLARLVQRGHQVTLVAVTSPRRLLNPARYAETLAAAREAVGTVRTVTHLPRHRSLGWVARRLERILKEDPAEVVHCRQSRAAAAALRAGATGVVADLKGVRPEEYLLELGKDEDELRGRERRRLERLRGYDREALAGAGAVVCVSEPFRRHLGGGAKVHVIPNASEPIPTPTSKERAAIRGRLGLARDELVFVYSGSLAPWQCAREAVDLFKKVRQRVSRSRIVLLTHDAPGGEALLRDREVADGVVRRLTPAETRATLPAFDVALLLRKRDLVNEVSSPVKFAEYLWAGLPVILTEGIGDASSWVAERGMGLVLPSPGDGRNAERVADGIGGLDGGRCREFARERLSFEVTAPLFEAAYRSVAGRNV